MKRIRWLWAMTLLAAAPALAADLSSDVADVPRWSVELKGGRFTPETEEWSTFFSRDSITHFEAGIAYKPFRQFEVALNGGYLEAEGKGFAPLHGTTTGDVRYELFPVHVAILWRATFSEDQVLVPYVGGGWTRFGYRQQVKHQSEITGSANGTHLRAGVQLLLDGLDRHSASAVSESVGIKNSYFFLEYQRSDVSKSGVELGGSATLGGLLVEF